MKVSEFVKNSGTQNVFCVLDVNSVKCLCDADKYAVMQSEFAEWDVSRWYVDAKDSVLIQCQEPEEIKSMSECIDEFFDFVDEMELSIKWTRS